MALAGEAWRQARTELQQRMKDIAVEEHRVRQPVEAQLRHQLALAVERAREAGARVDGERLRVRVAGGRVTVRVDSGGDREDEQP